MTLLKKIWDTFRFGLVLNELRYFLMAIGIEISPFYWTEEGTSNPGDHEPKNGLKGYSFNFFGLREIKEIAQLAKNHPEAMLISRLNEGKKCFGVKYNGQIVAFNWIDLDKCDHKCNKHRLERYEAHLFDGYTMKAFRGRNIAPFLRCQTYEVLRKMGKKRFYTVTQSSNKSAIKVQRKLKVKFLWIGIYINFFNKISRTFIIKRFNP